MTGELEVWNLGTEPLNLSFRHKGLPEAASKQARPPWTPSVTTLPPATAGEQRGPGKPLAGPLIVAALYLSAHTSSPLSAFRQRRTSWPSWRLKTYRRS